MNSPNPSKTRKRKIKATRPASVRQKNRTDDAAGEPTHFSNAFNTPPRALTHEENRMYKHQAHGVDWRWKVAQRRAVSTRPSHEIDQLCCDLSAVLRVRSLEGQGVDRLPAGLVTLSDNFDEASRLLESMSLRNAVDALVLARVSDEEISQIVGIPPEVIALYCEVFFDVRGLYEAIDALRVRVIDRAIAEGHVDRATMLKLSYHGGPVVAKGLIDYMQHQDEEHDLTTEQGLVRKHFECYILQERALITATPEETISMYTEMLSKEQTTNPRNATFDELLSKAIHERGLELDLVKAEENAESPDRWWKTA